MSTISLQTPDDVTPELAREIGALLVTDGIAHLVVRVSHQSTLSKRVVLATLPDSAEIMVAMEDGGCLFLNRESNINAFVFVTAGFQLTAAHILSRVFIDFISAIRDMEHEAQQPPQLTHQNRS